MTLQEQRRRELITQLLAEEPQYKTLAIPADEDGQRQLLRALMNVRPPRAVPRRFLEVQDAYLQAETAAKGITDAAALPEAEPGLCLWQGDITTLRCDAIVNAANSGMTGCYVPNHRCIDNCIHTFAGMQLRQACAELMRRQGHEEPTGTAKLTPAYNLPSKYVLHTVGPIVQGPLTARHKAQLASCYRACLELAAAHGLHSVAFCCISTGVFGYPPRAAAEVAVATVREFLQTKTSIQKVIFNVFTTSDREIYTELLGH